MHRYRAKNYFTVNHSVSFEFENHHLASAAQGVNPGREFKFVPGSFVIPKKQKYKGLFLQRVIFIFFPIYI